MYIETLDKCFSNRLNSYLEVVLPNSAHTVWTMQLFCHLYAFLIYGASAFDTWCIKTLKKKVCQNAFVSAHQIGTAYSVEHKRFNAPTAPDLFCIHVKEQRYHRGAGRDGGPRSHQAASQPRPEEWRPQRKYCLCMYEWVISSYEPHTYSTPVSEASCLGNVL